MAKFTFRLQALLNVKEQIEKNAKNELGVALKALQRQKEILNQLRKAISIQETEYKEEGTRKTTLLYLKWRLEYISHLKKKENTQQQRVNEEKRNVDKIKERLIEVMKDRKVLENLREKERIAFRKEEERAERVVLDEIVSFTKYAEKEGEMKS